jgi:hypothetical protein
MFEDFLRVGKACTKGNITSAFVKFAFTGFYMTFVVVFFAIG